MPKSACTTGLLALATLVLSSCGGDKVTAPADDVSALEAATVMQAASFSVETGMSNSPVFFAAVQSPTPASRLPAGAAGEFGLECPVVTIGRTLNLLSIQLEYGTGCVSQLDGQLHSGQITIIQDLRRVTPTPEYSFQFTDYTTRDLVVSGEIDGKLTPTGASVSITDLFLSGERGTTAVDAELSGAHDNNGTPLTLTDDLWQVKGNVTVTATDHKIYRIAIDDGAPIVLKAGCAWPVSGLVSVRVQLPNSTSTSEPTTLDFGPGDCDDAALVTLPGGQTQTIHLSSAGT